MLNGTSEHWGLLEGVIWDKERLTDGFLASGEPYHVRRVRCPRPAAKNGQDGPQTLCAWLSCTEHVEITDAGGPEVWRAMDIEIQIQRTPCGGIRVEWDQKTGAMKKHLMDNDLS